MSTVTNLYGQFDVVTICLFIGFWRQGFPVKPRLSRKSQIHLSLLPERWD